MISKLRKFVGFALIIIAVSLYVFLVIDILKKSNEYESLKNKKSFAIKIYDLDNKQEFLTADSILINYKTNKIDCWYKGQLLYSSPIQK